MHRDVFAGCNPSIGLYETIGKGAATFGAEDRKEDWREPIESLQHLGYGHHAKEILGFPRYADLREHVCGCMDWSPRDFRTYRWDLAYPRPGIQVVMAFDQPPLGN
ncbi:MAG: hypothetical protein R3F17_14400 [Planctomycetota bacterium]